MQMLSAAGIKTSGDEPAYEDSRLKFPLIDFSWLEPEQAGKLVWADKVEIPSNARCLITARDAKEQAKSEYKFHCFFATSGQILKAPKDHIKTAIAGYKKWQKQIYSATRYNSRLRIDFETMINDPTGASSSIAHFLNLDNSQARAMRGVVRERSPKNYSGLLELDLVG